jgi:hypothetical protein
MYTCIALIHCLTSWIHHEFMSSFRISGIDTMCDWEKCFSLNSLTWACRRTTGPLSVGLTNTPQCAACMSVSRVARVCSHAPLWSTGYTQTCMRNGTRLSTIGWKINKKRKFGLIFVYVVSRNCEQWWYLPVMVG